MVWVKLRALVSRAGRGGGPFRHTGRGVWCSVRLSCRRSHEPRPPFSALCAAVGLDTTAVDEQLVRGFSGSRQRAEDAFPNAALGPSHEPVIKRLLGSIDVGTVDPTTPAAKGVGDPAQHAPIIHARLAAHMVASSGSIRAHCLSENQKKSDISPPPRGGSESRSGDLQKPVIGPGS